MGTWDGLIEILTGNKGLVEERNHHEVAAQIPGTEQIEDRYSWVDLDRDIVHIALPPEPSESGSEPEPGPEDPGDQA